MEKYLMYKEKPLVRCDNQLFYGAPEDAYYVSITLDNVKKVGNIPCAGAAVIELFQNENGIGKKNKILKKSKRDGLYAALDVGSAWLFDALSWK